MFLEQYAKNFNANDFAKSISLEEFWKYKDEFNKISSNSSLRKIFDSYLDIFEKYEWNDFEIEKEIWFARIAYQEQRWLLPVKKEREYFDKIQRKKVKEIIEDNSFTEFLREIYNKLNNSEKFKQFLEVFIAYHKFFTWAK